MRLMRRGGSAEEARARRRAGRSRGLAGAPNRLRGRSKSSSRCSRRRSPWPETHRPSAGQHTQPTHPPAMPQRLAVTIYEFLSDQSTTAKDYPVTFYQSKPPWTQDQGALASAEQTAAALAAASAVGVGALLDSPGQPGWLSAPRVSHRGSSFYGAFVWAHRALNHPTRRVPAPGSARGGPAAADDLRGEQGGPLPARAPRLPAAARAAAGAGPHAATRRRPALLRRRCAPPACGPARLRPPRRRAGARPLARAACSVRAGLV